MAQKKQVIMGVLCFLIRSQSVLLGIKTRKIGIGLRNGFGGKIKKDESAADAVVRETREEGGIKVRKESLTKVAVLHLTNRESDAREVEWEVEVFLARKWSGTPRPNHEMKDLTWFDFEKLPYDEMMPADRIWLPLVLKGQTIIVEGHYGPQQRELIEPPRIITARW